MIRGKWSKKILVVVIIIAVVGGLVMFFALRNANKDTDILTNALNTANEKTDVGNYDEALQALKQAESQAKTTEQKVQLLGSLAAAAANAGQLSEALDYYEQKHQLDPTSAASDGYLVGELYERLGETQKAIEQFELYLGYIKTNPTEETGAARIESLEVRIQQMKEGQQ